MARVSGSGREQREAVARERPVDLAERLRNGTREHDDEVSLLEIERRDAVVRREGEELHLERADLCPRRSDARSLDVHAVRAHRHLRRVPARSVRPLEFFGEIRSRRETR
jgi:hypothetical protein